TEPGKKDEEQAKSEGDKLPKGAVAQLRNSTGATHGLAFAPDGRWLMVADGSREVCLLDRSTGKLLKSFSVGERGSVGRAVISQDGRLLAAHVQAGRARLHVWEIESGRARWRRSTEELNVSDLCFSPDGRTLALAGNQMVRLWDAATGKESRLLASQAKAT